MYCLYLQESLTLSPPVPYEVAAPPAPVENISVLENISDLGNISVETTLIPTLGPQTVRSSAVMMVITCLEFSSKLSLDNLYSK